MLVLGQTQAGGVSHPSGALGSIDSQPIYEKDIDEFRKPRETRSAALDRYILFQLAVREARRQRLDRTPEVQQELDRLLYQAYLKKELSKKARQLEPSPAELRVLYERQPMIRLRHLVLFAKTDKQKKAAQTTLKKIQKALKAGVPFKKLVTEYSEDSSARFAGDLDFKGAERLPAPLYQAGLALKKGGISIPIQYENAYHLVALLDRQDFSKAPATYLAYLSSQEKQKKEKELLTASLSSLKKKAKVKNFLETEKQPWDSE